jgi:hypothetical protein
MRTGRMQVIGRTMSALQARARGRASGRTPRGQTFTPSLSMLRAITRRWISEVPS